MSKSHGEKRNKDAISVRAQQSALEPLLLCLFLKTELLFTKARMADGSVRHLTERVQTNIPPHHSSPAFSRMTKVAIQGKHPP